MANTFEKAMASLYGTERRQTTSEGVHFEDGSSLETKSRKTISENSFGDSSSNEVETQVVEKLERFERQVSPAVSSRSIASEARTLRFSDAILDSPPSSSKPSIRAKRRPSILQEIREEIGRHADTSSSTSPTRSPTKAINGHSHLSFMEQLTSRELSRAEAEHVVEHVVSGTEAGKMIREQLESVLEDQVPQIQDRSSTIQHVSQTQVEGHVKVQDSEPPSQATDWNSKWDQHPHRDESFLSKWPFLKEQFQFFSSELVHIRTELARIEEALLSERNALRTAADDMAREIEARCSELREDFKKRISAATEGSHRSWHLSAHAPNFQAELREYKLSCLSDFQNELKEYRQEAQAYADRVGQTVRAVTEAAHLRLSDSIADLLRQQQSQEERLHAVGGRAPDREEVTTRRQEFASIHFEEIRGRQGDLHARQDWTQIIGQFEEIERALRTLRSDLEEEGRLRIASDAVVQDMLSTEKSERLAGEERLHAEVTCAERKSDMQIADAVRLVRSEILLEAEHLVEKTVTIRKQEFSSMQDDAHARQDRTRIMGQFEEIERTLRTLRSDLEEEGRLRLASDAVVQDMLSTEKSERLAGDEENLHRLTAALVEVDSGVAAFRDLMAERLALLSGKLG